MRVAIVDDDLGAIERLKLLINDISGVEVIGTARDQSELIEIIALEELDAIFLDVEFDGKDGIDIARTLLVGKDIEVVIVTGYSENSLRAYEIKPIDFILKPLTEKAVRRSIFRLTERIQEKRRLQKAEEGERLLSDISFQVLEWQPLDKILKFVCERMVQIFELPLVWVGIKNQDETVSIEAYAGELGDQLLSLRLHSDEVYRRSQPFLAENIVEALNMRMEGLLITDSHFQLQEEEKVLEEVRFCVIVPLKTKKGVQGYLALYAGTYELLQARQVAAFKRCAEQVSIALAGAVRRQEINLLTTAVESTANAILITDSRGVISWNNKALEDLTGFTAQEIRGKTPSLWKSGHHSHSFYETMWSTILLGKVWKGETINKRKGGSLYVEEMTITPVTDDQGHIVNFVAVKEDISQRRADEKALLKAKEEAVEAERIKSEFVSIISHELRTPLNGILGMNELLIETELDDEQQMFSSTVQKSAQDLLKIIEALLTFSDIKAGNKSLKPVLFDMHTFLQELTERKNYAIINKGLTLIKKVDPAIKGYWCGDPLRLRQILDYLLDNAIKFTDKGEILLRVTIEQEGNQEWLRFDVADKGVGMTKTILEKLFLPFVQSDSSLERKYGGIGLGLTISKYLVELMGGTIWVTSVENEGTTVSFRLPNDHKGELDI
ncbi:PAS domain S-box protein [Heliorestis acidaminivorans]|uniref:Circadian input-output histidine kinase CikA n=1 Tax=Heliorestis acidaminivorans TaxID=553427 RepID=A0A6I0F1S9_9FIRM|nr:ATP-binding protein [Heliorestis acidaminivorans]KAB2953268.1 PAS domain S-box protein [Heliorestis acidaminivorans]